MATVNSYELGKLPHLNLTELNGRKVNLMPLWQGGSWHLWVPTPDGKLIEMKPVDAAQSLYLGKSSAHPDDFWIAILDLMWQRASFPDVVPLVSAIADDFHLLATSAAKLEYFHKHGNDINSTLAASFVESELEYIIIVARSVFDLTQEVLSLCWNKYFALLDSEADALRRRHPLPPKLSKVLYSNKSPRSSSDLVAFYALPQNLAETYAKHEPFFFSLRDWRDRIIHGINRSGDVFVTEKGFCTSPTSKIFSDFSWQPDHYYNENVVSLKPWVAHLILKTMEACSDLLYSFAQVMPLPEEIAPGYRVYLRDPSNAALRRLLEAQSGKMVWWSDDH